MGDISIADRVNRIAAELLGVETTEVRPESRFVEDLGADSLDSVELLMAFEDEFAIEIPDEDGEKLWTVQQVLDYLHAKGVRP